MIKFIEKYLIIIIGMVFIVQFIIVPGCSDQYTCGYDPALYKTKGGLLISFKDANIEPQEFVIKIEQFGLKNNFCIANASRYYEYMDDYLVNIRMVKSDYSFYVFGTEKYNFGVNIKNINADMNTDIEKFCQLIYSHIDTDKIKHYETGKLCE